MLKFTSNTTNHLNLRTDRFSSGRFSTKGGTDERCPDSFGPRSPNKSYIYYSNPKSALLLGSPAVASKIKLASSKSLKRNSTGKLFKNSSGLVMTTCSVTSCGGKEGSITNYTSVNLHRDWESKLNDKLKNSAQAAIEPPVPKSTLTAMGIDRKLGKNLLSRKSDAINYPRIQANDTLKAGGTIGSNNRFTKITNNFPDSLNFLSAKKDQSAGINKFSVKNANKKLFDNSFTLLNCNLPAREKGFKYFDNKLLDQDDNHYIDLQTTPHNGESKRGSSLACNSFGTVFMGKRDSGYLTNNDQGSIVSNNSNNSNNSNETTSNNRFLRPLRTPRLLDPLNYCTDDNLTLKETSRESIDQTSPRYVRPVEQDPATSNQFKRNSPSTSPSICSSQISSLSSSSSSARAREESKFLQFIDDSNSRVARTLAQGERNRNSMRQSLSFKPDSNYTESEKIRCQSLCEEAQDLLNKAKTLGDSQEFATALRFCANAAGRARQAMDMICHTEPGLITLARTLYNKSVSSTRQYQDLLKRNRPQSPTRGEIPENFKFPDNNNNTMKSESKYLVNNQSMSQLHTLSKLPSTPQSTANLLYGTLPRCNLTNKLTGPNTSSSYYIHENQRNKQDINDRNSRQPPTNVNCPNTVKSKADENSLTFSQDVAKSKIPKFVPDNTVTTSCGMTSSFSSLLSPPKIFKKYHFLEELTSFEMSTSTLITQNEMQSLVPQGRHSKYTSVLSITPATSKKQPISTRSSHPEVHDAVSNSLTKSLIHTVDAVASSTKKQDDGKYISYSPEHLLTNAKSFRRPATDGFVALPTIVQRNASTKDLDLFQSTMRDERKSELQNCTKFRNNLNHLTQNTFYNNSNNINNNNINNGKFNHPSSSYSRELHVTKSTVTFFPKADSMVRNAMLNAHPRRTTKDDPEDILNFPMKHPSPPSHLMMYQLPSGSSIKKPTAIKTCQICLQLFHCQEGPSVKSVYCKTCNAKVTRLKGN